MQLKASAPGSLMLLGEYAVLYGKPALVVAVNKRITVLLTPRTDSQIEIESSALGSYTTQLDRLIIEPPFQFVLGAVKYYHAKLQTGCHIKIISDFSDKVGLGSSAAVTVATLAALMMWLDTIVSPLTLMRQGRSVVRHIQNVGSGADIAASVYGGMGSYQTHPLHAEKISHVHPITVLYAGFKTLTTEVISHVEHRFLPYPELFRDITHSIGHCAAHGIQCARHEEWKQLGEIMTIQQGLMESLGVSTPLLDEMIADLRKIPQIVGVKISGSGLGDCVIGLGQLPSDYTYSSQYDDEAHRLVQRIPLEMSLEGVQCEKI